MLNTVTSTLEVEAERFAKDCTLAVVYCPVCAKKHPLSATKWPSNHNGIFSLTTWYTFNCGCGQNIAFMLAFPIVNMKTGEAYTVIKPAHSFGVIDGESVNFKETRMEIEVLPKPKEVLVCDGETETTEKLPDHLAQPDWYLVKYTNKPKKPNFTFWLNSKGCQVLPISTSTPNKI